MRALLTLEVFPKAQNAQVSRTGAFCAFVFYVIAPNGRVHSSAMKRLSGWATAIWVLCGVGHARADESKISAGLSSGYGGFLGSTNPTHLDCAGKVCGSTADTSDVIAGQIPLTLDAGYRLTPDLSLGVYGQYGFVLLEHCTGCSGHDVSFGIQARYRLLPGSTLRPWVGLGIGYESLSLSQVPFATVGAPALADTTLTGWELANIRAGWDFPLSRAFTLGPFVGASLGQFSHVRDPLADGSPSEKPGTRGSRSG